MKIDLNAVDTDQFMMHQHIINGEICWLIQPQHIAAKWNKENKIFRSSLWNNDGEPVSLGFPKFTNWGENPDHFPVPTSLKDTVITEKVDGSLLVVSKYKGQYILRTRGTSDASKLDNGHELEFFKQKYIESLDTFMSWEPTWKVSFLFEWVSPLQKIILNYGDQPDWFLVGIVNHHDYSLWLQNEVESVANFTISAPRPVSYTFPTVEELISNIEAWKGKEGVCVYSNNGQSIHKIKSLEYLAKHRFKGEATLENTLDLYFSMGKPDYQEFEKKLIETFDYECFEMVRGFISIICDAQKEVQKILIGFGVFVEQVLKPLPTRRDQAEKVLAAYSTTNRSAMIFTLLDGKQLSDDQTKKLFWQVLKK